MLARACRPARKRIVSTSCSDGIAGRKHREDGSVETNQVPADFCSMPLSDSHPESNSICDEDLLIVPVCCGIDRLGDSRVSKCVLEKESRTGCMMNGKLEMFHMKPN